MASYFPLLQERSFLTRRKISIACFCSWMFLSGMTYSAVLGTLWFYVKWYNSTKLFFGAILSISIATYSLISPIFCYLEDFSKRTRFLFLNSCFFFEIGLMVHSLPLSEYFSIIGLAICGGAGSIQDVILWEVIKITNPQEHNFYVLLLNCAKLLGVAFGPAVNLIFEKCNFYLGFWKVFYGNSSSLVISILWSLLSLVGFLYLSTLSCSTEAAYEKLNEITEDISDVNDVEQDTKMETSDSIRNDEEFTQERYSLKDNPPNQEPPTDDTEGNHRSCYNNICQHLRRPEQLVLLWIQFFLTLVSTAFITMTPLLANKRLAWSMTYTNVLLIIIGIVLLFTIASVSAFTFSSSHRRVVLCTLGAHTFFLPLLFLISYSHDQPTLIVVFCLLVLSFTITFPILHVMIRSLMSKLSEIPRDVSNCTLVTLSSCAAILGPIFGALFIEFFLPFTLLVNSLNMITLLMYFLNYRKFY